MYYTKDAPNWTADEFMLAMKAYSEVLDLLKSNGVKPRHKPELVARLKELPVICDSRNRLMGHSWVAIGDEDIWYCTYLLSSVAIENNIKLMENLHSVGVYQRDISGNISTHCMGLIQFYLSQMHSL